MNAQEIACENLRKHGAWNDNTLRLNHPSAKSGYGRILLALSILAPEHRRTQIQVAQLIGRPVRIMTKWYNSGATGQVKYFSTHGAWATLSNAKLIEKVDNAWSLTELGKQYVHEMMVK